MSFRKIRETIEAIKGVHPAESKVSVKNSLELGGATTATKNVVVIEPLDRNSNISIISDQSSLAPNS